jgi:hypothetical protein
MTQSGNLAKTTALALATSIVASGLLPIAQASAHDRHHAGKHGYSHSNWNKRNHRKFHRHYGRGDRGIHRYQKQRHHQVRRKKRNNKGDLIAAGIIGLTLGAIIASEASKNKSASRQTYRQPTHQPQYRYDGYGQVQSQQRIELDRYGNPVSTAPRSYNEPEVITYRDNVSLEPWTPGWREWCSNRYRSFNARTGTFRGYDGLDHFCVPK